jgi:hypothetical protein
VKERWKKGREEAHLQRFRENFAGFPDGRVIPHEHPDFLIETHQGAIGIEHNEYVREPNDISGSPLRARERTEDKVLLTASREHESKGLPPVTVYVHWNPHQGPTRSTMHEFATVLANLVENNLPGERDSVTIRYPHPQWRYLPQEIASLSVYRRDNILNNFWSSLRGSFVPTLTPTELRKIVQSKEAKVSRYRQGCQEVWLLIVANGFEPSTHCKLAPEVEDHQFHTEFDRAFFFHYFDGFVKELRTRQNGSENQGDQA